LESRVVELACYVEHHHEPSSLRGCRIESDPLHAFHDPSVSCWCATVMAHSVGARCILRGLRRRSNSYAFRYASRCIRPLTRSQRGRSRPVRYRGKRFACEPEQFDRLART
jgi:hypothetical protein